MTMIFLLTVLMLMVGRLRSDAVAAGALFVGAAIVHDLWFGALDGFAYYGSAALFDLGVILAIARLSEISEFNQKIQKISVLSIFLNAYGCFAWFAYLSPIAYNWAYIALYGSALIVFQIGSGPSVGVRADRWRPSRLFGDGGAGHRGLSGNGG